MTIITETTQNLWCSDSSLFNALVKSTVFSRVWMDLGVATKNLVLFIGYSVYQLCQCSFVYNIYYSMHNNCEYSFRLD